jgi:protease secretion system outer membrane protein
VALQALRHLGARLAGALQALASPFPTLQASSPVVVQPPSVGLSAALPQAAFQPAAPAPQSGTVVAGAPFATRPAEGVPGLGRLSGDLRRALLHDPEYQSAIAERDAGVENLEQARAALLPQVSSNLQRSINDTDSRSQTALGPVERSFNNYPAYSASVQLRQALYRPKAWATLALGKAQAELSELRLLAARQDLAVRLIGIHGEWAAAAVAALSAEESIRVYERLLRNAQRQFSAGDSTRTDVEVARARLSQAQSQLAEAGITLGNAQVAWAQITGTTTVDLVLLPAAAAVKPKHDTARGDTGLALTLAERTAEDLPLSLPILTRWQESALESNPQIRAQRSAVQAAREELRRTRADQYPAADVYASRSHSKSALDNTIGTEFRTSQIGVQVSVPIYTSGAISSAIRQSEANLRRVESDLQVAVARVSLQIDRDWRTLEAARAEAAAQRRMIAALRVVMEAATRGLAAGVATRGEEDQALIQLLNARRSLASANSRALIAWSRLMAAVGALNPETLSDLEGAVITGQ